MAEFVIVAILIAVVVLAVAITSQKRNQGGKRQPTSADPYDDNSQLARVSSGQFTAQPLMNRGEYGAFRIAETFVRSHCPGYRVFAQVSLGEILRCQDKSIFKLINSKRTDLLIVDKSGIGVLAIECQGDGHYQAHAPMRDAVKKEALRQAGIGTLDITPADNAVIIEDKIKTAMIPIVGNIDGNIRNIRS